ncbi:MAG: ABC transporter permease subunit [Streptosporangiales bacterium]|nr:ABC transporter permease subunit [Streptosporangiales bacterium]
MSTAVATAKPGRRKFRFGAEWLLVVPLVFLVLAYLVPLIQMVVMSVTEPGPQNYVTLTQTPLYLRSLWVTLKISLIIMLVCLVLGYPYAYVMHLGGRRWFGVLTVLVLLPFMSSLLVRTFAWTTILGNEGVINNALLALGIIDSPVQLVKNTLGTVIGMSHVLLPYMVLPAYATMRRIDETLMPAALGLGASRLKAFFRVYLPLSLPGVVAGCFLVFVLSIGFYITPELLGGPKDQMLGQLIVRQVSPLLQFGLASAIGVLLLVVTLVVLGIIGRFVPVGRIVGYEGDR